MRVRMVLITAALSVIILLSVFWFVYDSAAGQYEELLQRAYAFIAMGAAGRNSELWIREATDLFVNASVAEPNSAEAHLAAAMGWAVRGETERAVRHYEAVRALAPALPVDALIGEAYKAAGEWDKAEEAYLRALSVDSESVLALAGLAELAEQNGRLDDAVDYRRRVVEAAPQSLTAYLNLSGLLLRLGDPEGSYEVLEAIPAERRGGEAYYAQLGLVQAALEQRDEACSSLRTALRLGTQNTAALEMLQHLQCTVR